MRCATKPNYYSANKNSLQDIIYNCGAYIFGMLSFAKGGFSMECDIDDLIFGEFDPGPSER